MRSSIEALGQDQPFLWMETVNKSKHRCLSGYHSVFLQICYSLLAQPLNIILMEACVPSDFTGAVNTNYSWSYSDMCSVDILYSFFKVFFGGWNCFAYICERTVVAKNKYICREMSRQRLHFNNYVVASHQSDFYRLVQSYFDSFFYRWLFFKVEILGMCSL